MLEVHLNIFFWETPASIFQLETGKAVAHQGLVELNTSTIGACDLCSSSLLILAVLFVTYILLNVLFYIEKGDKHDKNEIHCRTRLSFNSSSLNSILTILERTHEERANAFPFHIYVKKKLFSKCGERGITLGQ